MDRDGTLIKDKKYLSSKDGLEFLPMTISALKYLSKTDFRLIIATNQSGISRGYFTEDALKQIHKDMLSRLDEKDVRIDAIYHCPHGPDEGCICRKPKTGMVERAKKDFDLNLKKCYFIGDKSDDVLTGINSGCKSILVKTGQSIFNNMGNIKPDYVAIDLLDVAYWIITKDGLIHNDKI